MLETYKILPNNEKLALFRSTLALTNRTPEYYVNWKKVDRNTKKFELELNTLNYLIGKDNIYKEAKNLFIKQPQLLSAIPLLIGSRDFKMDVLIMEEENILFEHLQFDNADISKIEDYMAFAEKSGLLNFLQNQANRSLVDYVYGVEVGLDSNGRKNRSGTIMETLLEKTVQKTAEKNGLEYGIQMSATAIFNSWGISVPVDKSVRRFDVVIYNPKKHKVYVIETNFYGGGGSKLKSVCGEFITLNNLIKTSNDAVTFIWITDGQGWNTALLPLSEAFEQIDYIFNIKMLDDDYLEQVVIE